MNKEICKICKSKTGRTDTCPVEDKDVDVCHFMPIRTGVPDIRVGANAERPDYKPGLKK